MDEIFGYFPPVANPPSKPPLLTLLKQARAFGARRRAGDAEPGRPRLQGAGERRHVVPRPAADRARQGARARRARRRGRARAARSTAGRWSRRSPGSASRVFLMNNVHEDAPVVFQTRWALSYLRGPLTRAQIKTLMAGRSDGGTGAAAPAAPAAPTLRRPPPRPPRRARPAARRAGAAARRAAVLPARARPAPGGATLVYRPMLLGAARCASPTPSCVDSTGDAVVACADRRGRGRRRLGARAPIGLDRRDLSRARRPARRSRSCRPRGTSKSYDAWAKAFAAGSRHAEARAAAQPAGKQVSRPGESERDFRVRLQEARAQARPGRGQARRSTRPRSRRSRSASAAPSRPSRASPSRLPSRGCRPRSRIGATLLGAFLGRKAVSVSTHRPGDHRRARRRAGPQGAQDVGRAKETVDAWSSARRARRAIQGGAGRPARGERSAGRSRSKPIALQAHAAEHRGEAGRAGLGAVLARPRRGRHAGLGVSQAGGHRAWCIVVGPRRPSTHRKMQVLILPVVAGGVAVRLLGGPLSWCRSRIVRATPDPPRPFSSAPRRRGSAWLKRRR